MTAAGTSAPTVIAPNTSPASGAGISRSTSIGTAASAPPSGARTPGRERRDAEEPEEREQPGPGGQRHGDLAQGARAVGGETGGEHVRVHQQGQRGAEGEGGVGGLLLRGEDREALRRVRPQAARPPRRRPRPGRRAGPGPASTTAVSETKTATALSAEMTVGARSPCR